MDYIISGPRGKPYSIPGGGGGGMDRYPLMNPVNVPMNQPPVALISFDKMVVMVGDDLIFSGSNSYDQNGYIVYWYWTVKNKEGRLMIASAGKTTKDLWVRFE